jgi:hypothetical protein
VALDDFADVSHVLEKADRRLSVVDCDLTEEN